MDSSIYVTYYTEFPVSITLQNQVPLNLNDLLGWKNIQME